MLRLVDTVTFEWEFRWRGLGVVKALGLVSVDEQFGKFLQKGFSEQERRMVLSLTRMDSCPFYPRPLPGVYIRVLDADQAEEGWLWQYERYSNGV